MRSFTIASIALLAGAVSAQTNGTAAAQTTTSGNAADPCQQRYQRCLGAGNTETYCQCDLAACAGEDNARGREYCASATGGYTVHPFVSATASSSTVAAAQTTSAATDPCQQRYQRCLGAGNTETYCQCDLASCTGEDNARGREYCASATGGYTVRPFVGAGGSTVAGPSMTTYTTASAGTIITITAPCPTTAAPAPPSLSAPAQAPATTKMIVATTTAATNGSAVAKPSVVPFKGGADKAAAGVGALLAAGLFAAFL